jgi:hypothetical protein
VNTSKEQPRADDNSTDHRDEGRRGGQHVKAVAEVAHVLH